VLADRYAARKPPLAICVTVTNKPKKSDSGNFAVRKKKNETANAQNNTFANRSSRHETKVCKRVVFLPTHQ